MQLNAFFPTRDIGADPVKIREWAQAAEDLGYTYIEVPDHVFAATARDGWTPIYNEKDAFHETFVVLGFLAATTSRIRLSSGVLISPQRQTGVIAKQAAEVDLLSGGRLRLGIGVGWNHVEYEALGQDFATRGARQEEQLKLLRRFFTEPVVDFTGRFERVDRAALVPRPARPIPIWLGGSGEAAFDRAARLADGFIFFGGGIDRAVDAWDRLRGRVGTLKRSLEDFGGDYVVLPRGGLDDLKAEVDGWREAGGTHVSIATMGLGLGPADGHIDYLASVAEALGLPSSPGRGAG